MNIKFTASGKYMSLLAKMRWFQKFAVGMLVFYMGLMLYVTVYAHLRHSGNTGLDMGKIHQIRLEAQKQKKQP
jgi:hypothetical protein